MAGWADRGVGRYISGYAEALHRRGALSAVLLAPELPPPSGLPGDLVASGQARWDGALAVRDLLARGRPVVHHVTAPFLHCEPDAPVALGPPEHWARSGAPRVVLLHDLIPLRAPRHYLAAPGAEARYRARAEWVAGADLIVTNSDWTGREAVDLLGCDPERVVTIGAGVSSFFTPADGTDDELFRFHLPHLVGRPFILTVAGSDARKGADRAVAALGRLVERGFDLHLLVIGDLTAAWQEALSATAAASGVAGRVVLAGPVDDELLRAAYRRAIVSWMPSLAEGAGLPILESAASGTPALASTTTALAETAADPAAWFDPTDVDNIADVTGAVVDSDRRRRRILDAQQARARASTWDAVAGRAVAAIDRLGVDRPAPAPRILVVGGDEVTAPVVAELSRRAPGSVDVVARAGDLVGPAPAVDPGAVGREIRPASYDAVVYRLGGDDGWVGELAGRYPGWLWWPDDGDPTGFGWEPLVRRSSGVIVGSAGTARSILRRLRPGAAPPPVRVLPAGGEVDGLIELMEGRYVEPVDANR